LVFDFFAIFFVLFLATAFIYFCVFYFY